jgi:dynein heavy chain
MVEKWLIQVEEIMIQSLMKVTEDAVAAYSNTPRERWVKEWPGQVNNHLFIPSSSSKT